MVIAEYNVTRVKANGRVLENTSGRMQQDGKAILAEYHSSSK